MNSVGVFSSEQLLKWLFTAAALGTRPTAWYIGLHSGDPGIDGAANEIGDANYARQSATFTADQPTATDPWRVRNDAEVAFPSAAASFTVTYITVWDASTAGNMLAKIAMPLARTVSASGVFSIPANELVITGD